MSSVPIAIYNGQLAGSVATVYTVPANRRLVVTRATLLNTTSTDRTVDIHKVPSGGSADATNQILDAKVCEADMTEPYIVTGLEKAVLGPGDTIDAGADSATAVTLVISGILFTVSSS